MQTMQGTQTGFELTTKYSIINFLYAIFPVVVKVDGHQVSGRWGTVFQPTSAGSHLVEVAWKMYWVIPMGKASMQIDVGEGQVARLLYKAPFFWFMPGKLEPLPV